MTDKEKIEWAKREFGEIARNCEELAAFDEATLAEKRAWKSIAALARRNVKILEQK